METFRNDDGVEYDSKFLDQKSRCLKVILSLHERLVKQRNNNPLCAHYLVKLENLKTVIPRNKSQSALDKCEEKLNQLSKDISNVLLTLSGNDDSFSKHSRSPDSTANDSLLTSKSRKYAFGINSNENDPDSTVNGESHKSLKSKEDVCNLEEEVSSSQESSNSTPGGSHNMFPTLFSRRRGNNVVADVASKTANSTAVQRGTVEFIMSTAKQTIHDTLKNHSSHLDDGMSSSASDEIAQYEGTLKSRFFTNERNECPSEEIKLSSMLQKMMTEKSVASKSNEMPPTQDFNDLNLSSNENCDGKQKKEGSQLSAREKLNQQISVVHRVGESDKINPSLKQLKSDVKKSSTSNYKSDTSLYGSEISNDRGSSMPISPIDKDDYRSRSPRSKNYRRNSDWSGSSSRSPLSHSRKSSNESPNAYRSHKNSCRDNSQIGSGKRTRSRSRSRPNSRPRGRPCSRSRSRSRSRCGNRINKEDRRADDRRATDTSTCRTFSSFLSTIGRGGASNESKKITDEKKNESSTERNSESERNPIRPTITTNWTYSKKKTFKVNTNLPSEFKSKINQEPKSSKACEQSQENQPKVDDPIPSTSHQSPLGCAERSTEEPRTTQICDTISNRINISTNMSKDPRTRGFHESRRGGFFGNKRVDPRVQKIDNISKNCDPRLDKFSKNCDPRLEKDNLYSKFSHPAQLSKSTFLNNPEVRQSVPPAVAEIDTNHTQFSRNYSRPPNYSKDNFRGNRFKSFPGNKNRFHHPNFPKKNIPEHDRVTHVKEQVKNSTEFGSPLEGIFPSPVIPKTGRGYGEQKTKPNYVKSFDKSFTIPKRKLSGESSKTNDNPDSLPSIEANTNNHATGSENCTDVNIHDSAIVESAFPTREESTTDANNKFNDTTVSTHDRVDEGRGAPSSCLSDDIATPIEDECWDPIDSPVSHHDESSQLVASDNSQKEPITIDICDDSQRIDVEDLTRESEIIEIEDSDEACKAKSPSQGEIIENCNDVRLPSNVRSEDGHSLEDEESNKEKSTSNTEFCSKGGRNASGENTRKVSPENDKSTHSGNELTTKLLDYLKSLPNPPELLDSYSKLSAPELLFELFTTVESETLNHLKDMIAQHKANQNLSSSEKAIEKPKSRTKKNIVVEPDAQIMKKASIEKPRKKTTSELDRLHADIDKLKHTRNNVLDIGGTRRCRTQKPPNYNERKSWNSKNLKKGNEEFLSSESEFEMRRGIKRSKKILEFGSDSDNTSKSESSRKVFKSRPIISSESSSDADSESDNIPVPSTKDKKATKSKAVTHSDILKYKACPRLIKIKRFGSLTYENFEEVEAKKESSNWEKSFCGKEAVVVIPKYPKSCEDGSCFCSNHHSFYEHDKISNEGKVIDSPCSKNDTKSYATVSKKNKKSRTGKFANLRVKMNKNLRYPNWEVLEKQKESRSRVFDDGSANADENLETSLPDASRSPDVEASASHGSKSSKSSIEPPSSVISDEKEIPKCSDIDDQNDEDLEKFPAYNAFKNPDVTNIQISSVGVKVLDLSLVYSCQAGWRENYETTDVEMMMLHINFLHKKVKCNEICNLCSDGKRYVTLKSAFRHILDEHLDVVPVQKELPEGIKIKEEPMEIVPTNDFNDEDSDDDDCSIREPVQTIPIPVNVPKPTSSPSSKITSEAVPETPKMSLSSSSPSKPPKLRVRFSPKFFNLLEDSQTSNSEISNANGIDEPSVPISHDVTENTSALTPMDAACDIPVTASANQTANIDHDTADIVEEVTRNDLNTLTIECTEDDYYMMNFFKCTGENCKFSCNLKKEFLNHLNNKHKSGTKRNKKFDQSCLLCKYCKEKFETPTMLVIHLEKYANCQFQCAYCSFRACRPVYLLWHQVSFHSDKPRKILTSNLNDNKNDVLADCANEKNDLTTKVKYLNCVHCAHFETISFKEYQEHWKEYHSQMDTWQCYICKAPVLSVERSLNHLMYHLIGEYQCIYCIHGAPTEDAIKVHLTKCHYTLYPKALRRISPKDSTKPNQFHDYIEILDYDEPVDDLKKYFCVVDESGGAAVTLHAETSNGDTRSATGIYVLNKNMDYMLDEEATKEYRRNQNQPPGVDRNENNGDVLLPANDNEINTTDETNDVVAIDSSDDDNVGRLVINEDAPVIRETASKTVGKSYYKNGLSGVDLYKCGFIGCNAAFENYVSFKEHLPTCDNARNRAPLKCAHCNRNFQKNVKFLTHIGTHGVSRFICSLCDGRFISAKKTEDHIKSTHKVLATKVIPANPLKDNVHEDLYIVLPDPEKGGGKGNKQIKKITDTKKLPSTSTAMMAKPKEADIPAKQITTVYSLQDVQQYLPMQLFTEPVTCGICSTYSSKVRGNIMLHLKCHSTGLVPVNDITNPVPCIDKSELMFNKMTNHAAFSAKTDDKKIKCCLIEKVESYSGNKDEVVPGFVPKLLRYSCSACEKYQSTDANTLKSHWEALHPDLNYNCAHCGKIIPLEKIHTHLRYHDGRLYKCYYCTMLHYQRQRIESHQIEEHPDLPFQLQIIRDLSQEEMDELNREARYNHKGAYSRNIVTCQKSSEWKCNLCKVLPMRSEEAIKSHCLSSHRIGQKFKCGLCVFANDDKNQVNEHMKEKHESISQVVVTVYKETNEVGDNSQPSSNAVIPNTTKNNELSESLVPLKRNCAEKNVAQPAETSGSRKTDQVDDLQSTELNSLFILPLPNNCYKCPFCEEYSTADRKNMTEHLYQEKKYERYFCYDCGTYSVTEDEIINHAQKMHKENINIGKFSEDEVIEKRVEQILDYQKNKFAQVNNEASLMIVESSDEEDTTTRDLSSSSNKAADSVILAEFQCPYCSRICSNSSGLKNHINYVHVKRNSYQASNNKKKNKAVPIVPKVSKLNQVSGTIVKNLGGVFPCSYCNEEFSSDTIAKHLCACPSYTKSADNSPRKPTESKTNRSKQKLPCPKCEYIGEGVSLNEHIKVKHQPMECLNCDRVLFGTEGLNHHASLSAIKTNGLNLDCIPREKQVMFMCPYCPLGIMGKSFDNYMYISDHIVKKHNPTEKPPKSVKARIGNNTRELLQIEIAVMQNKFNNEQSNSALLQNDTKKKRNVAVKSTSRISASNIASIRDGRTSVATKIQRVCNDE